MNAAEFIAAQRTDYGVSHAVSYRALGVAESAFYERRSRWSAPTRQRRADLDTKVEACFAASGGTYGSPGVHAQLRQDGVVVSKKTAGGVHGPPGPARPRTQAQAGSAPR